MKYIRKSIVDIILFDNNLSIDDIKREFSFSPESWACVLKHNLSLDDMKFEEFEEFKLELFEYIYKNFINNQK